MIPRVIHCCWFGGRKTKLAEKCLASWRRFAPDWKIREWDLEEMFSLSPPQFVKDAVAARKWAFAADWLRFAALHAEGGVYFDMDVELVASLSVDGEFVAGECMLGGRTAIGACALALEKGSAVADAMLAHYGAARFETCRTVGESLEEVLGKTGLTVKVLPPEVFCPIDVDGRMRRTERTVGIHRCAMSWCGWRRRFARWLSWHGMRPLVDLALRARRRR